MPLINNAKFILISQQRVPSLGLSLEFPRGGVDPNESRECAVLRELKEKTGAVMVDSVQFLGEIYPETATLNCGIQVYLAKISIEAVYSPEDFNEIQSVSVLSEQWLKEKIKNGTIKDGITCAAYALLKISDLI